MLDATGNWWGSDQPAVIIASIYDYAVASNTSPIVDFSPYLSSQNGVLQESTLLYGYLGQDFTIESGESVLMMGGVVVPEGVKLTIEKGATLTFTSGTGLAVHGDLDINGTSNEVVTLTLVENPQGSNSWVGVTISGEGVRNIHHVIIEKASFGLHVLGGDLNVFDSLFDGNNYGIRYEAQGSQLLAANNVFSSNNIGVFVGVFSNSDTSLLRPSANLAGNEFIENSTGINVSNSWRGGNVTMISGNRIENNEGDGIQIYGTSAPSVTNNLITGNAQGVATSRSNAGGYLWDPEPVINNNNIYGNTNYNIDMGSYWNTSIVIDATQNWWGTTVLSDIEATINHSVDNTNFPTVDYSPISQNVFLLPPVLTSTVSLVNDPIYALTGRSVANTQVDVYNNNVFQFSVMADPQGEFSANINLMEGLNTINAKSADGGLESAFSEDLVVTLDTILPTITLTEPQEGEYTNQIQQWLRGSLDEAVVMQINGIPVPLAADNSFNYGPTTLIEGANAISLDATDPAGNITSQILTVNLDTASPATPDAGNLTTNELSGPVLEVSGNAGSAEPSANIRLVNARTGETATSTVNPDGSFTINLAGLSGDSFYVLVQDQAGNASSWLDYTLSGTPPASSVSITQPVDNAVIAGDHITVAGTVQAASQSSVVVNGIAAIVSGNQFQVSELPLLPGTQSVEVIITSQDGTTVSDNITVTSTTTSLISLSADEPVGAAPHDVIFTLSVDPSITIQQIELDIENDGTVDITETDPAAVLTYTYTNTGLYTTKVTVTDTLGTTHTSEATVLVRDLIGMSAIFRGVYDGMMNALRAEDVSGAMLFASGHIKEKYESVFLGLGVGLPAIVDQLGQIVGGSFGSDLAEIYVARDEVGQLIVYSVYLVKGVDGVWRVSEM